MAVPDPNDTIPPEKPLVADEDTLIGDLAADEAYAPFVPWHRAEMPPGLLNVRADLMSALSRIDALKEDLEDPSRPLWLTKGVWQTRQEIFHTLESIDRILARKGQRDAIIFHQRGGY